MGRQTRVRVESGSASELDEFLPPLEEAASWLWDCGIQQWEPGSQLAQREHLRTLLSDGQLLLARVGTEIAGGCILTSRVIPEWEGRPGPARYLHKLVVQRAYAGKSLGRQILSDAESRASRHGSRLLRLDCWEGNRKLRAYYRAAGFGEVASVASQASWVRLFEKSLSPADQDA